jgi:hypothetical protein
MIIGFAVGLADAVDGKDESIGSFVCLVLLIVLFAFFAIGRTKCEKSKWVYSDEPYAVEKIVSLNDNNMMNGRIYLRSGYIEEDLYYQYIVKLNNGGFVANKVKSANATLFYDTDNYRVEWHKKTRGWLYFKDEATYVEIYIPEGSITMDYTVDLN